MDKMLDDIDILEPQVAIFESKLKRLNSFNLAAAILPFLTVGTGYIFKDSVPVGNTALASTVITAATVQISRWQKGNLRAHFNSIWDKAEPETRPMLLGFLEEAFASKVGKSVNIVSREDIDLKKPLIKTILAGTAAYVLFSPVHAPLFFFLGLQTKEFGDGAMISNALKGTYKFYTHLKATLGSDPQPH